MVRMEKMRYLDSLVENSAKNVECDGPIYLLSRGCRFYPCFFYSWETRKLVIGLAPPPTKNRIVEMHTILSFSQISVYLAAAKYRAYYAK